MHFSSANYFKKRTFDYYEKQKKKDNSKKPQLFQMFCSALNILGAREIPVDTSNKNHRNRISIEIKKFILKEFIVFPEAVSLMNLEI